ncbi:MAG: hypothetical protein ACRDFX_04425 [Chloroflexota bacterium]
MFPTTIVSFIQLGVLVSHKMPPSAAFQVSEVSSPDDPAKQSPAVSIARGSILLQGPESGPTISGAKPPSTPIPDAARVVIRGTLICGYATRNSALFTNLKGKPQLNETSWRLAGP